MRGTLPRDIFGKDLTKRTELIILRGKYHWSLSRIGRHFGLNHTTIIYNLNRFAPLLLKLDKSLIVRLPLKTYVPRGSKYQHLIDQDSLINVNPGKSYKEYRMISKEKSARINKDLKKRLRAEFEQRLKRRGRLSEKYDPQDTFF